MAKKKELHQYTVSARLTIESSVLVEATSPEEAAEKAERREWIEDGRETGELTDYSIMGMPHDIGKVCPTPSPS